MSEESSHRLTFEERKHVVRWTIENFNLVPFVTGAKVFGPIFCIGTNFVTSWQLLLYAQEKTIGATCASVGYDVTDFFLCLTKLGTEQYISAEMKVVIQNARGSQRSCSEEPIKFYSKLEESQHNSVLKKFSCNARTSGRTFTPLSDQLYCLKLHNINLNDYLENNALIIIVTITVVQPTELLKPPKVKQLSFDTPTSLADDLKKLYINKKLCDFTLKVGNDEIFAHKAILAARSPVFATILQHDTKESKNNCVVIEDAIIEVMRSMIWYMYTGYMEKAINAKIIPILYSAANRYQVHDLKETCCQFLVDHLDVENVCFTYERADRHNDESLKKAAESFIVKNSATVLQSKGWKCILNSNAWVAGQILQIIAENQKVKR